MSIQYLFDNRPGEETTLLKSLQKNMRTNKDGSPDMRYAENRNARDRKQRRAILLAILLGALFACAIVTFLTRPRVANEYIFDTTPSEGFYENVEPVVTPTPSPRACYQNIDKIRCIGEDLGYDNDVIKTMIRIHRIGAVSNNLQHLELQQLSR